MTTIKKIILLVLTTLTMVGCTPSYEEAKKFTDKERNKQIQQEVWHNFHVEIIDSCEYLLRYTERASGNAGYGQSFMAHKGNCRFCKERRQKELEELMIKLK